MAEGFTCDVKGQYRPACERLGFYGEHKGKRYCVLHFPGNDKKDDFKQALQSKHDQKLYDFGGVYFPGDTAAFGSFNFEKPVSFSGAIFSGRANFIGATFHEVADFTCAHFKGEADFSYASFKREVDFSRWKGVPHCYLSEDVDTFEKGAIFRYATFEKRVSFSRATFNEVANFDHTAFQDEARFSGEEALEKARVVFQDARMDKPGYSRCTIYGYVLAGL